VVEIERIEAGSAAEAAGVQAGDRVTHVNGQAVRDVLDFHFHSSGEELLDLALVRGVHAHSCRLVRDGTVDLGLVFVPDRIRLCGNQCVFCFIDQNPEGLRRTLYVKDEDYRLSFLHGNFVTLTNMKEWEIRRVVEQRLSPMYISVHSTNPETRRRLLRSRKERDIGPILDYFRDHEIVMHTQIVLCPGINDGEDLEGTIRDLAAYYPAVRSLAVVPLGMTDHRDGLFGLERITPELAERIIGQVEAHQARFRREWGLTWLYLSDEWYRLLGRPVPPETHYDGYPQLENGIGMTRNFLNRLAHQRRIFGPWRKDDRPGRGLGVPRLPAPERPRRITVATGALFQPILEEALRARLGRTGEGVELQVVGVPNDFFGRAVTVAGLLAGRDLAAALEGRDLGELVVIPPATLNDDGIFLDDMDLPELEGRLGTPVRAGFRDRWW